MYNFEKLKKNDSEIYELILKEIKRQKECLEMIPSENYVSESVLETLGTILTNKYSEGQPFKRYYGGNEIIDKIESITVQRIKKLFNVEHVNVQPYSGSPANLAVLMAICKPGDIIMGQGLSDGGHLTHGFEKSATGIFFKGVPYHVNDNGYLDMEKIRNLVLKNKPKLIWCGISSYPREIPFKEFSKIADEVGAYLVADIAHISGLIVAEMHNNPIDYVHVITSTLHKTLRGPRSGMIMITKKGMEKDSNLPNKIDKAVFPGLQGGPHNHTTAAVAVAIGEALKPEFKEYGKQIIKNSKKLANKLMENKIKLVTNGTDNHIVLIDLTNIGIGMGIFAEKLLDIIGITVNKNTIPNEQSSPFYPSGIRLGTPAITSRGMKENEMNLIADWITDIINLIKNYKLPESKNDRKEYVKNFVIDMKDKKIVKDIRIKVKELCKEFPIYEDMK